MPNAKFMSRKEFYRFIYLLLLLFFFLLFFCNKQINHTATQKIGGWNFHCENIAVLLFVRSTNKDLLICSIYEIKDFVIYYFLFVYFILLLFSFFF